MFKQIKRFIKNHPRGILCVILLTGLQVLTELILPRIMARIVDFGLANLDMKYILENGLVMIAFAFLQVASMLSIGLLSARISSAFASDLRRDIFVKAETFSLTDLNNFTVSSMIVRNTNDVTVVQNFIVMFMRMVLSIPVLCIGSLIAAFRINSKLSLIIVVAVPVLALFFTTIILLTGYLFVKYREKLDHLNLLIREHLSGTRVIRAFVNQASERKKFTSANEEIFRISLRINRILSAIRPGMMFIVNLSIFALCYFGIVHIEEGTVSVGELMSLVSYFTMILMSLSMMSFVIIFLPRSRVSANRINAVLSTEERIKNPEHPKRPEDEESAEVQKDTAGRKSEIMPINSECGAGIPKGTVEFRNVCFGYPDSKENVIDKVSFTAEGGKTTAIIGSTGSGKSTLQRLIIRLYDVSDGCVFLDGIDVRDYSLTDLRERVGYIPQKAVLFTGTVADNVRFGKGDATDEEVENALKTSQSWDFVSCLEGGINSVVAQGGKNFSGGQKQRLAIARALIKDCRVMVFDDSFSALDNATDARLREALENDESLKYRTKIIIAQRISTVMNADKIIVLDKGKKVAEGKHKELLKTSQLYREIAQSQLSPEELENA